jgi:hypothetical protein
MLRFRDGNKPQVPFGFVQGRLFDCAASLRMTLLWQVGWVEVLIVFGGWGVP